MIEPKLLLKKEIQKGIDEVTLEYINPIYAVVYGCVDGSSWYFFYTYSEALNYYDKIIEEKMEDYRKYEIWANEETGDE